MQNRRKTLMLSALCLALAIIAAILWSDSLREPKTSNSGGFYYKGPKRAKSGAPYYVTEDGRIIQPGQEGTPLIKDGNRGVPAEGN